jgi:excinuclease ABC subunit C
LARKDSAVNGLFSRLAFRHFGPNRLDPSPEPPPLYRVASGRAAGLRAGVRQDCPREPGVYGMVDDDGDLVYVGKAKSLRARLLSYFRPASRDAKAGRILEQTRAVVWEPAPSEFAALLRELELIRRWQPRFNVQGRPNRWRHSYVCLGRRPAPYAFLTSRPPAGVFAAFGPVQAGRRAGEAVRRLNDYFRLRDCPQSQAMAFADQGELFPADRQAGCLRLAIATCLGPCAGACTRADYLRQVRAAQAYLSGADAGPLEALEREMTKAAAELVYERAAVLRDKLEALRWLSDQLGRLRQAREHSFVYPVAGHDGGEWWYLISHGRVAAAVPAPRDADGRRDAAAAVEAVYHERKAHGRLLAADEVDGVLLVAAWFRNHPEERSRVLEPDDALRRCRPAPG